MADKYYLEYENKRNALGADTFNRIIKIAFGADEVVIDGHHFMFAPGGDIKKGVNEIPSADTLIFDHDIMYRVFGDAAVNVMIACARKSVEERDKQLEAWLNTYHPVVPESVANYNQPETAVAGDYPETAGGY